MFCASVLSADSTGGLDHVSAIIPRRRARLSRRRLRHSPSGRRVWGAAR